MHHLCHLERSHKKHTVKKTGKDYEEEWKLKGKSPIRKD